MTRSFKSPRANEVPGFEPGNGFESVRTNDRTRVGFLAVVFCSFGGTETWHCGLLPRLAKSAQLDVAGFVTTLDRGGDPGRLPCRVGHGRDDARHLAASVDVLVDWGTENLAEILPAENGPRIISVHHGDPTNNWGREMIEAHSSLVDYVACVNPRVAADLQRMGARAVYIPNGVPDHSLSRRPRTNRRPTVLWLGRFAEEKRPGLVVEIAARMPLANFRIIGQGRLLGDLERAARSLNNVQILPPVQTPWAELAAADVLLSTSTEEGFGYVVAEAMLAQVPVVATPFGLAADPRLCSQVGHDATALEWAAMIDLSVNFPDRNRIDAARLFVLENHSIEGAAARWQQLILSTAESWRRT